MTKPLDDEYIKFIDDMHKIDAAVQRIVDAVGENRPVALTLEEAKLILDTLRLAGIAK